MSALRYPPGPTWKSESRRPLSERLAEAAKGPIPLIRGRFETYGDLYYVSGKNDRPGLYVLRHPDHIREVLVNQASAFLKRSKDLRPFLGQGLLTSNGAYWRRHRRLMNPAFQKNKMASYTPTMVEHTRRMLDRWRPGEARDIGREMMELTLSVVCKALLDYETTGEADQVAKAMTVLQETTAVFDPFPEWLPTPLHLRRKNAVKQLDAIIYPLIDSRDPGGTDLIAQLKSASDEQGTMSREELRDELVTMFLAGHETTALAMTWAFYELSQNPEEEKSLHEELDRVLGRDRAPAFEDLDALVFTRLCVQETLRMYPPIYILPRVAAEDTEIAGYSVRAGAELIIWVYLCQRDARWFPNPDRFVPGRWLPDTGGVRHAHAYLPFGAGPRTCIGIHFGMAEATLLLAAIAQRYRLRLEPGQNVQLNPRVTLGPKSPIMLRIEERR